VGSKLASGVVFFDLHAAAGVAFVTPEARVLASPEAMF